MFPLVLNGLPVFYKKRQSGCLLLAIFLLIARVGFNWFVLPERYVDDTGTIVKATSEDIGRQYRDKPLYIYKNTRMQPANSFYLTVTKNQIIPYYKDTLPADVPFILDPSRNVGLDYEQLGQIYMRHLDQRYFDVGKFGDGKMEEQKD
jgi:hypothetical protein